jgi:uncharacterized protein
MSDPHTSAAQLPLPFEPFAGGIVHPTGDLPDHLHELEALLQAHGGLSLAAIDGLVAAVAVCPEPLPPDAWLPRAWAAGEPDFADADTARRMRAELMRHYDATVESLRRGDYDPIFGWDAEGEPVWDTWIAGFMLATMLAPEAWAALEDHPNVAVGGVVMSFMRLAELAIVPAGEIEPLAADALLESMAAEMIAVGVPVLYRNRRRPARRARVGRNDPCPCGSGRKYKKCCGA